MANKIIVLILLVSAAMVFQIYPIVFWMQNPQFTGMQVVQAKWWLFLIGMALSYIAIRKLDEI